MSTREIVRGMSPVQRALHQAHTTQGGGASANTTPPIFAPVQGHVRGASGSERSGLVF